MNDLIVAYLIIGTLIGAGFELGYTLRGPGHMKATAIFGILLNTFFWPVIIGVTVGSLAGERMMRDEKDTR